MLVPTVTDEITEELLKQPDCKLRLIANFGNGVDNIDVTAAHARGITVTNTPKVLDRRHRRHDHGADPRGAAPADRGCLDPDRGQGLAGLVADLDAAATGSAASGSASSAWAASARPWRAAPAPSACRSTIHNRTPVAPKIAEELGATYWESLDQMLARMDIISVNCPHTPATFHLLSARRLKLIRKDAYIVNTARGEVIDEDDADQADRERRHRRCRRSTSTSTSPRSIRSWCGSPSAGKVTLLPHMGSATIEGRVEMGEKVIINIRTFLDNHKPPDRVLPSML